MTTLWGYQRTIVSATNLWRYEDSYTEIMMDIWFEEFDGPFRDFVASPLDPERHGKELWIRAMAGEFGSIRVVPGSWPELPVRSEIILVEDRKLLTHGPS